MVTQNKIGKKPNRPLPKTRRAKVKEWYLRITERGVFVLNPLKINEDLPLHLHAAFWLPIAFFVGWALVLTTPFMCLCMPEPANYEILLKQLGFPLLIASLSVPVSVAVARFHASKQRAMSNRLTEKNNAFNHFFDHRKYFSEYLADSGIPKRYRGLIGVSDINVLYSDTFPRNSVEETNYNSESKWLLGRMATQTKRMIEHINKLVLKVEGDYELVFDAELVSFIEQIPAPFGLKFSRDFSQRFDEVAHISDESFFAVCFTIIKDTLESVHQFNHATTTHESIKDAFEPLLNSLVESDVIEYLDTELLRLVLFETAAQKRDD